MALVLVISTGLPDDTLHKTLGECPKALPWVERSNGSRFMKKRPGGTTPDCLEADGACKGPPERVDCSQLHRIRLEIFLTPPQRLQ